MILHPAVIALLMGSLFVTLMVVYAAFWGWRIIDGWDLQSGSERQLALEKKTYLISTLMTYAFGFQILSFFLFVYVADDLHRLFVGAMCAAGTLNVNENGYPAVVLKVLNCLLAGVWLVLEPYRQPGLRLPADPQKVRAADRDRALSPGGNRAAVELLPEPEGERHHFLLRKPVQRR